MIPNNEHDSCACCGKGKGEIPIADINATYWICDYCDSDNSLDSKGIEPRGEVQILMKTLINNVVQTTKSQEILI